VPCWHNKVKGELVDTCVPPTEGETKRITIIHTGGTIGGESRLVGHQVRMKPDWEEEIFQQLTQELPSATQYEITYKTPLRILSEKIVPKDWVHITEAVEEIIRRGADGIVVTHGTDTMVFTTAALSFMLRHSPIPIVFTGALRPLSEIRSDAITNLVDSVVVAGCKKLKGIYVVFPNPRGLNTIYLGNRIGQIRPFEQTFDYLPGSILGHIRNGNVTLTGKRVAFDGAKDLVKVNQAICDKVAFFHVYPGFDPWYLRAAVDRNVKAILLYLYHSGTGCTREGDGGLYSLTPTIRDISSEGVPVLFMPKPVSREGRFVYPTSQELVDAGAIPLPRMTWEVALVKLMWALGQTQDIRKVKNIMISDIAGEICQYRDMSSQRFSTGGQ